ncbi:MAG: phage major capsid protein [Dysgonamonadaceae bacterium]|jgi:HK97 family phage major capsid protein|nr:phage major capsid protein [Dysgonamonadaceae bacterium]
MKKKLRILGQNSLAGIEGRRNLRITAIAFSILFVMAVAFTVNMVINPASAAGLLVAAPLLIPIIKGGNPGNVDDLDQGAKDALATIQKQINDALAAIELKDVAPEMVEKAIDSIVSDAMDELKSKDKNGNFAQAMKELSAYGETIKSLAKKLDQLENGGGLQFGNKSCVEQIVDTVFESEKFKEFSEGRSKSSGKIRFETKDVTSLTGNYTGDKLITTPSDYIREHPQPRSLHFRDIMLVEQGEQSMPTITFTQIYDLDRNAAVTSENGSLAESSFKVKEITEQVKRIGSIVFVSNRMLKSLRWLRSWLTNRLPGCVRLAEDFQILKGDGQGNNFLGLMRQCPDFKDVLGTLITGAAGSIKSVTSYAGGTQTLVEFTDPIAELNNGMSITFAGFTGATGYNAKFTVNKLNDRQIVIDFAYNSAAVVTAATFTAGGEYLSTVEAADIPGVISAAQAYLTYGEYKPSAVSMNPIDVFKAENLKDTTGKNLEVVKVINGVKHIGILPIVETTAMVPGEFLIGDFTNGASLVDFTALEIEMSEDVQTKRTNQVALIIQEEVIMPVYNPYGFLRGKFSEIIPLINRI